jgi:hypothetical protein
LQGRSVNFPSPLGERVRVRGVCFIIKDNQERIWFQKINILLSARLDIQGESANG